MTNGLCNITVQGVKYSLYFNRLSQEELTRRSIENPLGNPIKLVTDLIYSGMVGFAFKEDLVYPKYGDVADLVEEWFEEPDFREQNESVDRCFRESKFGKATLQEWEETGKKLRELNESLTKDSAATLRNLNLSTDLTPSKQAEKTEKPKKKKSISTGKASKSTA